jgi:hypothetical protein
MNNIIQYITDERGVATSVIVPLKVWHELSREHHAKEQSRRNNKSLLEKLEGSIHLTEEPLKFQKRIRDEWK